LPPLDALLRFLVAALRYQLGDGAAGRPEFHRDDAGIADDLATVLLQLIGGFPEILYLDGEVVYAGPLARGFGFRRLRAFVILDEREIDSPAVGEMPRQVVACLARLGFLEAEHLLIELRGLLQVLDLERQMDDAVHLPNSFQSFALWAMSYGLPV